MVNRGGITTFFSLVTASRYMCKDKQRGNYERGCFDIMSISLNRLLRFDAKVRVCVKKLKKKQYASWILLYFGHAARGRGKKNIIFEFLCFDLQRWSPRGRPWPRGRPRGHILKSLALALASRPQVLENWPVLGSRTAVFFELLKFCGAVEKFFRKRFFVEIA